MFKIYIGNVPVFLCAANTEQQVGQNPNTLHVTYRHKFDLKDIIKYIETNTQLHTVYISGTDFTTVLKDFFGQYKILTAAGGLVQNNTAQLLFIQRNNRWDLPKGKVEADEKISDAALREVSEETGIQLHNLEIIRPVFLGAMQQNITCHTYFEKGLKILKLIHWYEMMCSSEIDLKPQEEEGISEVRFLSTDELNQNTHYLQSTYPSIRDVLSVWLEQKSHKL